MGVSPPYDEGGNAGRNVGRNVGSSVIKNVGRNIDKNVGRNVGSSVVKNVGRNDRVCYANSHKVAAASRAAPLGPAPRRQRTRHHKYRQVCDQRDDY